MLASLFIFLLGFSASAAAETIVLSFPNAGTCASNNAGTTGPFTCSDDNRIFQGYGDTATVDFTYKDLAGPSQSLYFWSTGYNTLVNIVWADQNGRIEIAPIIAGTISLDSLDVGAWLNVTLPITVRVLDLVTSTELYTSGVMNVGPTSVNLTPGVSSANGLALVWDATTQGGKFGLDNITVTTTASAAVPEPGSGIFLATGLVALLAASQLTRSFRR